jgi:hypothetical protein
MLQLLLVSELFFFPFFELALRCRILCFVCFLLLLLLIKIRQSPCRPFKKTDRFMFSTFSSLKLPICIKTDSNSIDQSAQVSQSS